MASVLGFRFPVSGFWFTLRSYNSKPETGNRKPGGRRVEGGHVLRRAGGALLRVRRRPRLHRGRGGEGAGGGLRRAHRGPPDPERLQPHRPGREAHALGVLQSEDPERAGGRGPARPQLAGGPPAPDRRPHADGGGTVPGRLPPPRPRPPLRPEHAAAEGHHPRSRQPLRRRTGVPLLLSAAPVRDGPGPPRDLPEELPPELGGRAPGAVAVYELS